MNGVIRALQEEQEFIITSHEHPDPDSIGSMLGLGLGLQQLGKSCRMVSADPPPANLDWPGIDQIEVLPCGLGEINGPWIIVLDCEPARTGSLAADIMGYRKIINIDHHQGNMFEGALAYVDPTEAATSVMVYRILKKLGICLSKEIATALYGGIVGDTGGFRYANTTAETLSIAAELVESGIDPARIAEQIFASQPIEFMRLLGYALTSLKSDLDGRLVWIAISYEDFVRCGADPAHTDQLVQYARMVDTARIAILFRETKPGEVRIGFRSDTIDVEKLAGRFGGGGHRLAAGAKLSGPLEVVTERVLQAARNYLNEVDKL